MRLLVNNGGDTLNKELELSIIIINYLKYEMTRNCIDSLVKNLEHFKYEVIVLDNCSPNNSFEILNECYRDIEHIRVFKNEVNNGFGAGNNLAVRYAKSKYILFLNPDVILLDNSICAMLDLMKKNHGIGIVGSQLLNADHSLQYSCRRFLPFNEFIVARTPFKKIISKAKAIELNDKYLMKDIDHYEAQDVDWLMGSCLLVRKSEFLEIGGFSKEYFMYFEDVDLCYKYRLNNQRVHYYPQSKMIHLHEQESTKKINKLTFRHLESMFKFYRKYKVS